MLACVLIARPFVELGINDDFTYIRSAQYLAQTGHIAYFGWGSLMLGWQLYLGACFIKLFGFSFTAVRFAVLLVAAATIYLLHRTLVRCGISEENATTGALTIALSPLFLPLAFSFMTDVPGLFSLLLCLYLCLRSLQSVTDATCFHWLVVAALSNVLTGTVRQTAWLGVILIVPSTLWLLRTRRIPWVKMALVWLSSLLCIYICARWFHQQPHVEQINLIENLRSHTPVLYAIRNVYHFVISTPLFLCPILAAFISPRWVKSRKARFAVYVSFAVVATVTLTGCYLYLHHPGLGWLAPWGNNYVTQRGLIDVPDIGVRPTVLGPWARITISFLVYAAVIAFAACIASSPSTPKKEEGTRNQIPTGGELAFLLAPFTVAYFVLLLPRAAVGLMFDRYQLPLLAVALIVVLRLYQEKVAARLPALSRICLILFAAYGVAALHDLYSMERARFEAGNQLQAAGISRTGFYGGIEYDGWTQIDSQGYVIAPDPNPSPETQAAYSSGPAWSSCDYELAPSFPAIQPKYALSFDTVSCNGPSQFAPVPYHTWLPPFSDFIYIQAASPVTSRAPDQIEKAIPATR